VTLPRPVLPNQLVFLTRRAEQRQFLFRPEPKVTHAFRFLLAVGCAEFQLELVAAVLMSNHYHLLVLDRKGRYPAFTCWFNSLLGRTTNHLRGRGGHCFGLAKPGDVVVLDGPETVLSKAAYLLTNPVAAGAVRAAADWPGACSKPSACARPPETVVRPPFFFRDEGLPDTAELRFFVPPTHADQSPEDFGHALSEAVVAREEELRAERQEQDRPFQGPEACRKVAWTYSPDSKEPAGPGSAPVEVMADDAESQKILEDRLEDFRKEYARCRAELRASKKDIIWPAGTWAMVQHYGARALPPP